MNMPTSTNKTFGQTASNVADDAANAADSAIRSGQRTVDDAADTLSSKVDQLRAQAGPLMDKAQDAARRGMDAMRESTQQLRERAQRATDTTVAYVKDEPIKSMLIAAATGAVLMGVIALLSRSRDDDRSHRRRRVGRAMSTP